MATTITGKLNQSATTFAAGESTGFGLRIGVQYYDRDTQQKEWTNYECVIFAKAPAQINFYKEVLAEGAIVELTGQQIKIKQFEGQNGLKLSLELVDAKLGYAHNPNAQANPQPQQGGYQQPRQQPQPHQGGYQAPQNVYQGQPQQQQQQGGYQVPPGGYQGQGQN